MLGFLKATWDHLPPLPQKPRLPPSLLALKSRKAWLAMRPKFTYGDERDKIQRDQERRARRQLARDEAWVKYEKKKQERLKQKQAQKELRMQKKAAASAKSAVKAKAKSATAKRPPTTGKTTSSSSWARVAITTQPARMATQRRVVYAHVPAQAGSGKPKPIALKQPVTGTRPAPQTRKTMPLPTPTRRPTQAWGPIAAATQKSPVASPRVRSQTMPVTTRRR